MKSSNQKGWLTFCYFEDDIFVTPVDFWSDWDWMSLFQHKSSRARIHSKQFLTWIMSGFWLHDTNICKLPSSLVRVFCFNGETWWYLMMKRRFWMEWPFSQDSKKLQHYHDLTHDWPRLVAMSARDTNQQKQFPSDWLSWFSLQSWSRLSFVLLYRLCWVIPLCTKFKIVVLRIETLGRDFFLLVGHWVPKRWLVKSMMVVSYHVQIPLLLFWIWKVVFCSVSHRSCSFPFGPILASYPQKKARWTCTAFFSFYRLVNVFTSTDIAFFNWIFDFMFLKHGQNSFCCIVFLLIQDLLFDISCCGREIIRQKDLYWLKQIELQCQKTFPFL